MVGDKLDRHPCFDPYYDALHHISIAEGLLGAAQAKLMRSLVYQSLAQG